MTSLSRWKRTYGMSTLALVLEYTLVFFIGCHCIVSLFSFSHFGTLHFCSELACLHLTYLLRFKLSNFQTDLEPSCWNWMFPKYIRQFSFDPCKMTLLALFEWLYTRKHEYKNHLSSRWHVWLWIKFVQTSWGLDAPSTFKSRGLHSDLL